MWQAVLDWLPDLKVGTIEIRDLVSLTVGGLGAFLAYLAIKLGKEQAKLGAEQTAIAKRQAEIAEVQHKITLAQLEKKAVLSLYKRGGGTGFTDSSMTHMEQNRVLAIVNEGTRPARDIYWLISAPWIAGHKPYIRPLPGNVDVREDEVYDDEMERWASVEGRWQGPVYPGQTVELVSIGIEMPHQVFKKTKLEYCEYALECEDGRVPAEGVARMDLRFLISASDLDDDSVHNLSTDS